MKHICVYSGSMHERQILRGLVHTLQCDQTIAVTTILCDTHISDEMEIRFFRIEQDGFVMDEKTHIRLKGSETANTTGAAEFEDTAINEIFARYMPDLLVVFGSTNRSLKAAIAAALNHIPIAHIQGGESGFGVWDTSYGYGISKLASLHFTASERYRNQVIEFGEPEEAVFNTGSLLLERINTLVLPDRETFCRQNGISSQKPLLFIDVEPDPALGSKNNRILDELFTCLDSDEIQKHTVLFRLPSGSGLAKMTADSIRVFCERHPGTTAIMENQDLNNIAAGVEHCRILISNTPDTLVMASGKKRSAIRVLTSDRGLVRGCNQIDCRPDAQELIRGFKTAVAQESARAHHQMISPFEQNGTAQKIAEEIKRFHPADILPKKYYRAETP